MTAGGAAGGGVSTRCLIADDQAMVRRVSPRSSPPNPACS